MKITIYTLNDGDKKCTLTYNWRTDKIECESATVPRRIVREMTKEFRTWTRVVNPR